MTERLVKNIIMPKTEAQYKKIRQERIKQIKQIALELFADNGYHNTSIQKIAQKAEISKGLLYNYFKSKEDLLNEIINDFLDNSYKYFDPNHDGILTDDEFYYFIEKSFDVVTENPVHWKLYFSLSLQPTVTEFIIKNSSEYASTVSRILFDFFKNKKCVDTVSEILFFTSLLKGAVIQYISKPQTFPIENIKNKIIEFYKNKFQN